MKRRLVCSLARSPLIATVTAIAAATIPWIASTPVAAQGVPSRPTAPAVPVPTPSAAPRAATTVAGATTGAILGMVIDSLHDTPLADAVVTVVQLPRKSAITTAKGLFRIDSVPPGRYTLEILHPLLDSLGIRVVSDTVIVATGAVQAAALAVPGEAAIVARVCPDDKRKFGPGAIIGQVLEADSNAPAAGADITIAWIETQVSTTTGVQTTPSVRRATVAEDGTYRLCGIPAGVTATVQASRGSAKTAEVKLAFEEGSILGMRFLRLAAGTGGSDVRGALVTGPATISGMVTNNGGVPINGVRVTVIGSTASSSSADDGTFTLSGVPTGTQNIEARRVGYEPIQVTMDVTTQGPNRATVRLGEAHPVLKPVEVKATLAPELDRVGFTRRKKAGMGRYMTEEDIDKIQPTYTTDILRHILGIYVYGSGSDVTVVSARDKGCVRYLIDENRADATQGASIDELVNPKDVAAVEFYQQNDVPGELQRGRNSGCALVVVWTKAKLKPKTPQQ